MALAQTRNCNLLTGFRNHADCTEVLQPTQPKGWFAYLDFYLKYLLLDKFLGLSAKPTNRFSEDFPTVQLKIFGKHIIADLDTVLMK